MRRAPERDAQLLGELADIVRAVVKAAVGNGIAWRHIRPVIANVGEPHPAAADERLFRVRRQRLDRRAAFAITLFDRLLNGARSPMLLAKQLQQRAIELAADAVADN